MYLFFMYIQINTFQTFKPNIDIINFSLTLYSLAPLKKIVEQVQVKLVII